MPKIKELPLDQKELALIKFTKALSHPARISILNLMLEQNSCFCGELTEVLPLSQSTISQHLKELKDAGLIYGTGTSQRTCYCINQEVWAEAKEVLSNYFKKLITE